jgi:hypothetical protein
MSTQMSEVAETTTAKVAKRKSVTLTAAEGTRLMRLTLLAQRTRGDGGTTVVVTTDAKKKTSRGMTTKFGTFALAVSALDKLVKDAVATVRKDEWRCA